MPTTIADDTRPHARVSGLFPTPADRSRVDLLLSEALAGADTRVSQGPVTPTLSIDEVHRSLARFTFANPEPLEDVLSWTVEQLVHGTVHMGHPRYFGLFNPAPSFPSQCADRIAGAFNPQLATATTSPAPVAIEAHVIQSVARRAGLPPESGGHFTTGGTEANFTALVCALTATEPAYARFGARAFAGMPVFYVSEDSHLAWLKIAHQAGLGREAVRLIATDGGGRMQARALADAVQGAHTPGGAPNMNCATGTTNAGMIDPLGACAEIARRFGLWFHVDAAWGGAVIASEPRRHVLAGMEIADSVTIDAHKWFATTMGCGMILTPHVQLLSDAFRVSTTFMPSNTPLIDPYATSVQWSRRFLGLRLFLSLAAVGWDGYAEHVEHAIGLAAVLREELTRLGWRIVNDSELAVLCFEPPPNRGDARAIAARVLQSGRAWISLARFGGRDVLRACVTNGQSSLDDVLQLVDDLTDAL